MTNEEILEEIYEDGSDHGTFLDFLGASTEILSLEDIREKFAEVEDPADIRFYGRIARELERLDMVEKLDAGYALTGAGTDAAMRRYDIWRAQQG